MEQLGGDCNDAFKDGRRRPERDPLTTLRQIEDEENPSLDSEAVAVLAKLIENVEEFYELRTKFKSLIEDREMTETKLIDLFQTLIHSRLDHKRADFSRVDLK